MVLGIVHRGCCSGRLVHRASQSVDIVAEWVTARRLEVVGIFIHPSERAFVVLDRQLGFAARFVQHRRAHEPVDDIGILLLERLTGRLGLLELTVVDQVNDAVREPVQFGL